MKRSGFTRPTYAEAIAKKKAKVIKKPRVKSPKTLKAELWDECKRIVRSTYVKDGMWRCFTCDRLIDAPAKAQTGHFLPSAACGAYLRYDLRNLRIQCYFCNINLGGNGAEYHRRLVIENGQEYVDQLFRDKNVIIKADSIWYQQKIDEYKNL